METSNLVEDARISPQLEMLHDCKNSDFDDAICFRNTVREFSAGIRFCDDVDADLRNVEALRKRQDRHTSPTQRVLHTSTTNETYTRGPHTSPTHETYTRVLHTSHTNEPYQPLRS